MAYFGIFLVLVKITLINKRWSIITNTIQIISLLLKTKKETHGDQGKN